MRKILPFLAIPFAFAVAAQAAEVKSLVCVHDARPVDGGLSKVQLKQNASGKYDVVYTTASSGFGGGDTSDHNTVVATNLKCVFSAQDSLIVNCNKSSQEENESINSGFVSNKVQTHGVGYDGRDVVTTSVEITMYSPQLQNAPETARLPSMHTPLEFRLEPRSQLTSCKAE